MSDQLNVKHKIADTCRKIYSYFKPISNTSSFIKNGTLTPEEFVDAGDFLVHKFKTWEWQEADKDRNVSYLPEGKQFLITRNAPCKQRLKELNYITHDLKIVENEWLHPNYEEDNNAIDINEYPHNLPFSIRKSIKEEKEYDNDDDVIDINNFDIEDSIFNENDPASVDNPSYYYNNIRNDNTMKIRTYDISITYDKYYQTPRIWLFGYDENGNPLKPEEIFEDVLADYSYKTVTYDPHPCTGIMTASIHPCRHADAMLKIIKNWINDKKEPRHDLYLLFLLKFVSGVIPSIEYDFTTDIEIPRDYKK
ncbi:autophagy-related protein 3, putative [Plasmodium gallinaceum]|uniref:Autophagy-related protein 3, putative n=1 Tax=Plasmodium gallinaceum TaxID=5849 RepID=A0A1J1GZ73_PLAGA|nr:autophagy-related protein 3, putative [Plasmodium gallinaceum]CRG96601.1 autophagy-related protein 3, putative [Plasmodium gallinaceum]